MSSVTGQSSSQWTSGEDCVGTASLVGKSREFTEKTILNVDFGNAWKRASSLTCLNALRKSAGCEDHEYQPPFISCIVRKSTFTFNSRAVRKNREYESSNAHEATCAEVRPNGETVTWYTRPVQSRVTVRRKSVSVPVP